MSKQRNVKLWAWIGLIVAGLVLGLNALLSQQGNPLPQELTDFAEDVVATSVVELELGTTDEAVTEVIATVTRVTSTARPTRVPTTASEDIEDAPWFNDTGEGDFDYYVLALSWQPAFCETESDKTECVTQSGSRYDAHNFALHGLWPNLEDDPNHTLGYCDVTKAVIRQDQASDWCALPQLSLSETVWTELTTFMPGTASCLQNHEWYKHGTCTGMSAEAYFALSNHLTELFSQTAFDDYVANQAGSTVNRNELLDLFAREFGSEARNYLSLRCSKVEGVSLLTEIQVILKKDIAPDAEFGDLFPTDDIRPSGSCPTQIKIDLVGFDNF
ncbi:MAG: hypothetical protein JXA33_20540 [Anaerolineae bacterium]|nr:hypothetical protein [Anaerolineae bacterium]